MNDNIGFLKQYKRNKSCQSFIIAECGVHHRGDLELARQLIDAAAQSGADAVKFQTYKAETLVTHWAPTYWKDTGNKDNDTQFNYFSKRDTFELEHYRELSNYAREKNINFFSTPFDQQAVEWLNALDVPFYKIASADINNYPLLEGVAGTGRGIILSTGASYFHEIKETVSFLRAKGVKNLALLHCTLSYPTPESEANLHRILELKNHFPDLPVGYSDHTIPDSEVTVPVLAVALGARIIEKHFTLDRTLPEDDHYHSADSAMLGGMINRISIAEKATALKNIEVSPSEQPARKNARRSLVAQRTIPAGSIIDQDMIIPKRPGDGIPPSKANEIVGKRCLVSIPKDTQITWELLE